MAPDPADLAPHASILPAPLGQSSTVLEDTSPTENDVGLDEEIAKSMANPARQTPSTGAPTAPVAPFPSTSAPGLRRLQPLKGPRVPPTAPSTVLEVVGRGLPPPDEGNEAPKRQGTSWDALWSTLHALEDDGGAAQP